jgi:hypothetical protein
MDVIFKTTTGLLVDGGQTLWKLVQKDVAISLISAWQSLSLYSGQERATPAQAASTCIQSEGLSFAINEGRNG